MKKLLAFTLAETLIVIGIIGVVSALTLPNLNSSTGEKEKVAKVKKIYQNLDDALGRAVAIYGPVEEWFVNDTTAATQTTRFGDRITEFMKVSKNCGMTANQGCFAKKTRRFDETLVEHNDSYTPAYRFILADGTSVYLSVKVLNYYTFFIDIDGPNKGQQRWGSDIFYFYIDSAGNNNLLRRGGYANNFNEMISDILKTGVGYAATNWVISYDNMDYLKADSNGKCSNGKTLTEDNPRCN